MQITWYGHSAFRLDFAGHAVLIDPFFTGNPAFVSDKAAASKGVKHIVLTHGHGDHVGDALDIARSNSATVTTRSIEFRPDGTAWDTSSGTAVAITSSVSLTVTRSGKTKTITVNSLGKVLQQ